MEVSLCLLAGAMLLGQAGDRTAWQLTPQLAPGLELVYRGSYVEESLIPNVQFQRQYRLDNQVLVLDSKDKTWNLAVMTSLSLQEPRSAPGKIPTAEPTSVRLELARVTSHGNVQTLAGKPLAVPVIEPPTVELGFLVDVPSGAVRTNHVWEAAEADRPPRTWQAVAIEPCGGVTCVKLVARQQSDDWDRPRADRLAWRRRDTVWLTPQLMVAQKVERIIERREAARQTPTQRATIRYELENRLRYPGRLFEDRVAEISKIRQFQDEVAPALQNPAQNQATIEQVLRRIAFHNERQPPTPYRKALVHFTATLEQARKGESIVQVGHQEPAPSERTVEVGGHVPDFVVSSLTEKESARFSRHLGKPVLVVFYNPGTRMGRDVLLYAKSLAETQGKDLSVLAMAVTRDSEAARKQHAELQLPFPVLEGNGMRPMFGVDATPRVVLIDREGIVRAAATGWGYETPVEIFDALRRCREK